MMKTQEFYLSSPSTPTTPSTKKLSYQEHRNPVVLIVVSVLVGSFALVYLDNMALGLALFAAAVGFAGVKAYRLKTALEQPVITTASPRIVEASPRPTVAEAEAILGNTTTPEAAPVTEVAEIVMKADDEETVLYKERKHWMLLVENLLRTVPVGIVLWVLALTPTQLADAANRSSVVAGLVTLMFVSGTLLVTSFLHLSFKSKSVTKLVNWLFGWLRWPTFIALAIAVVYLLALKNGGAMVSVVAGLAALGTFWVVRSWAKWYYTYLVVTTKMFGLEREIPWVFLLKDSKPAVPIRKLTSVTPEKSTFEKAFNLACGSMEADTPGELDKIFHNIRRIRDHERMANAVNSMIA